MKKKIYTAIAIPILAIGLLYAGRVFFRAVSGPGSFIPEAPGPEFSASAVPAPAIPASGAATFGAATLGAAAPDTAAPSELSSSAAVRYPNLRLEGTIIAKEPSAYIRDLDSRQAGYYSIGDKILNAALIDIKRGRVLMDIEGHRYSLYLGAGPADDKKPFEEASPSFRLVREGDLLSMVNSDEEGLKTLAEITPHRDREGTFAGYKVEGVKPGSLASLAGLRNGDIINRLNNQQFLTQQKAIQTFRKVRKLKSIQIGLLRDSKEIALKYKIK